MGLKEVALRNVYNTPEELWRVTNSFTFADSEVRDTWWGLKEYLGLFGSSCLSSVWWEDDCLTSRDIHLGLSKKINQVQNNLYSPVKCRIHKEPSDSLSENLKTTESEGKNDD